MPVQKVYLELTNRCNLNCAMCYRHAWDFQTQDMNPELLDRCLKEIVDMPQIKDVVLGGIGEPTYCAQAAAVMRALKGKVLTVTTNGTLMDDELCGAIVDCVDHLVVSVDGGSEAFMAIRQFSLEVIVENMQKLNRMKRARGSLLPEISVQMVVTTSNQDQMEEVIDYARQIEASQVIVSNMLPSDLEDGAHILYKRYENEQIRKRFQQVRSYAFLKGMEIKMPAYELKTERRCRFIEDDTMVITASGDIAPCYRFAHDGTEVVFGRLKTVSAHSFGNIAMQTLEEIWNSPAYVRYRTCVYNNQYPSCIDCDLVDGCDMVRTAESDCYGNSPSCADCLWARRLIYCV